MRVDPYLAPHPASAQANQPLRFSHQEGVRSPTSGWPKLSGHCSWTFRQTRSAHPPGCVGASGLGVHDRDRAAGVAHDLVCDGAEHELSEAAAPAGADDHEVRVP